jgi:hypothetical protein
MIYVIVKERGEYSDYSMQVLCAYTNKEVAEAKLKELEEVLPRLKTAQQEYQQAMIQFEKECPFPRPPFSKGWEKTAEGAAFHQRVREYSDAYDKFRRSKCQELNEKHRVSGEEITIWHDEPRLSIEEVEGY